MEVCPPLWTHGPPTSYLQALREHPPPVPPQLIKKLGCKEISAVGKVKVLVKVSVQEVVPGSQVLAVDKRKKTLTLFDPGALTPASIAALSGDSRVGIAAPKIFAFDGIFTADDSQTEQCSSALTDAIVSVLRGNNDSAVICFGQPNLGQGYTMFGGYEASHALGVVPSAIWWLYKGLEEQKSKTGARYSVRVSAVEVSAYDTITDLLAPYAQGEEAPESTLLGRATEVRSPTPERAAFFLDAALSQREPGRASHLLFVLSVYQHSMEEGGTVVGGRSRLHILDFGAFDRGKGPGRLTLSAMGNVLLSVFNGQRHLPFKDSLVSRLVSECVGSVRCTASMLVHVSAQPSYYQETLAAVQLASRVHRLRRRRIKHHVGGSGSGGSSEESRSGRSSRGTITDTGSSSVDPSSSEQSCDTVIYVGPGVDDATDGEHPPVYLPETECAKGAVVKAPLQAYPVEIHHQKSPQGSPKSRQSPVGKAKDNDPKTPSKCSTTRTPIKHKNHKYGVSDEQWVDGPRVSRPPRPPFEGQETWVDGPEATYGFMDEHKKTMIEKWVETQNCRSPFRPMTQFKEACARPKHEGRKNSANTSPMKDSPHRRKSYSDSKTTMETQRKVKHGDSPKGYSSNSLSRVTLKKGMVEDDEILEVVVEASKLKMEEGKEGSEAAKNEGASEENTNCAQSLPEIEEPEKSEKVSQNEEIPTEEFSISENSNRQDNTIAAVNVENQSLLSRNNQDKCPSPVCSQDKGSIGASNHIQCNSSAKIIDPFRVNSNFNSNFDSSNKGSNTVSVMNSELNHSDRDLCDEVAMNNCVSNGGTLDSSKLSTISEGCFRLSESSASITQMGLFPKGNTVLPCSVNPQDDDEADSYSWLAEDEDREYIEVEEPEEPVDMVDSWVQVTEEDIDRAISLVSPLSICHRHRLLPTLQEEPGEMCESSELSPIEELASDGCADLQDNSKEPQIKGNSSSRYEQMINAPNFAAKTHYFAKRLEELRQLHEFYRNLAKQAPRGRSFIDTLCSFLPEMSDLSINNDGKAFPDFRSSSSDLNWQVLLPESISTHDETKSEGEDPSKDEFEESVCDIQSDILPYLPTNHVDMSLLRQPDGASNPSLSDDGDKLVQVGSSERLPGNGASFSDDEECAKKASAKKRKKKLGILSKGSEEEEEKATWSRIFWNQKQTTSKKPAKCPTTSKSGKAHQSYKPPEKKRDKSKERHTKKSEEGIKEKKKQQDSRSSNRKDTRNTPAPKTLPKGCREPTGQNKHYSSTFKWDPKLPPFLPVSSCPGYDSGADSGVGLKVCSRSRKSRADSAHGESSGYESVMRDSEGSSFDSSQDSGLDEPSTAIDHFDEEDVTRYENHRTDADFVRWRRTHDKIRSLRETQDSLKKELTAAKDRLMIDSSRWSFELHVEDCMTFRDAAFLDAFAQETRILQKRVIAARSHLEIHTCFDILEKQCHHESGFAI